MDSLTWIDPDGVSYQLTAGPDIDVEYGVTGRLMPLFEVEMEPLPSSPGSRVRGARVIPRPVGTKVWLHADTEAAFRLVQEKYGWAFQPTRGTGTLRSTRPDGTQRDLRCVASFIPGPESLDNGVESYQLGCALVFTSPDALYTEVSENVFEWNPGAGVGEQFPWDFPFVFASSTIFAADTIVNYGQHPAWPLWEIVGPGSGLEVTNLLTGRVLGLDYELAEGETVSIDTRTPGNKTVTNNLGTPNLFGKLTGKMWAFEALANGLQIAYAGADASAGSKVRLRLRCNFNAP